jgi:hypothetical protein
MSGWIRLLVAAGAGGAAVGAATIAARTLSDNMAEANRLIAQDVLESAMQSVAETNRLIVKDVLESAMQSVAETNRLIVKDVMESATQSVEYVVVSGGGALGALLRTAALVTMVEVGVAAVLVAFVVKATTFEFWNDSTEKHSRC